MTKVELYWLAAVIECEGGFYAIKNKGGISFRMQFYNSNKELHDKVSALTGAKIYYVGAVRKQGWQRKDHWMAYCESSKAVLLAEKLMPAFSNEKRLKTLEALEKYKSRNTKRGRPRKA